MYDHLKQLARNLWAAGKLSILHFIPKTTTNGLLTLDNETIDSLVRQAEEILLMEFALHEFPDLTPDDLKDLKGVMSSEFGDILLKPSARNEIDFHSEYDYDPDYGGFIIVVTMTQRLDRVTLQAIAYITEDQQVITF